MINIYRTESRFTVNIRNRRLGVVRTKREALALARFHEEES